MNKLNEKVMAIKSLDWLIELIADIGLSVLQVIIAGVTIKILTSFIRKSLMLNNKFTERKRQTLSEVLASVVKYTVWFIAICSVLTNFGVNVTSLIAVAGVGSVAIGFGAQSLVQDIITGMFILFEDQFGVGDIITVDRLTGTVESIGLRSTKIRSADGDLHIIPNGIIKIVTNMSKEFNRATIDIGVAYEENIDRVISIMKDEVELIFKNKMIEGLIASPKVLGIIDLADSSVIIRILADTEIGENWQVEREIRRFIKKRFDKENINIPYPKRIVEIVENKRKEV
ncbi:mechanosensitive ion channel family protein [uncultured Tyzzerella sp.]|uniref:mechanosensitive ion channel family protein n=1 Tax=uncultured Tyzzerella sp. TaxID=2321398 RepID=UPI002942B7DF|nr:mechanosensitive ion channel family protein [uncultured Tyzzerella sp.]